MASLTKLTPRLEWLLSEEIRPFVLARKESRVSEPGGNFSLDWFPQDPLFMNPLRVDDVYFSNALLNMEARAFQHNGMGMPRWVFFDCAIMPGFISGFAHRTETLPEPIIKHVGPENLLGEWTPISMFIVIPTMVKGEWVAHNLSSVNSLIPRDERFYGLGFLSKAFGLAYANIDICCGMTQWGSPALKLHSHYGFIELLTAYTPAHTYASTLTYRLKVNPAEWVRFFTKEESDEFIEKYEKTGLKIHPGHVESQLQVQRRIEQGEGPFYLNAAQVRVQKTSQELDLYQIKQK